MTNKDIGIKLRDIRKHNGLTLDNVQKLSDGVFTIVAVGSYERGSRTISLPRFIELCKLYNVPADVVLKYPRMTCKLMCEDTYV